MAVVCFVGGVVVIEDAISILSTALAGGVLIGLIAAITKVRG